MSDYRQKIEAMRDGDVVRLRMRRELEAREQVFNRDAAPLARLLAAGASGVMDPTIVEKTIAHVPHLREAVAELSQAAVTIGEGAQVGDVTIGAIAGRDIVTITVNVYGHPDEH